VDSLHGISSDGTLFFFAVGTSGMNKRWMAQSFSREGQRGDAEKDTDRLTGVELGGGGGRASREGPAASLWNPDSKGFGSVEAESLTGGGHGAMKQGLDNPLRRADSIDRPIDVARIV